MATMNPNMTERRHIPDRRVSSHGPTATLSSTSSMPRTDTHARSHGLSTMDWIAMILTIVGGINWGLIGLFDINLVSALFGEGTLLTRLIYIVVGLSALYALYTTAKMSRNHS